MIVVILEKVSVSLKGELTKWMLEPRSGIFVGSLSGMVREHLWEKLTKESKNGSCVMIFSDNSEQGFSIRSSGVASRQIVDFDGLLLIRIPS